MFKAANWEPIGILCREQAGVGCTNFSSCGDRLFPKHGLQAARAEVMNSALGVLSFQSERCRMRVHVYNPSVGPTASLTCVPSPEVFFSGDCRSAEHPTAGGSWPGNRRRILGDANRRPPLTLE